MSRTNSIRYVSAVFCLLLLIFASANVFGQQLAVAQLSGHAVDPSGAALPDATVRMIETERGVVHTAKTNDEGLFVLPGLPVGPYRLEVGKTGFKTFVQNDLILQVNDHVTINPTLQPGQVSETIEVTAGPAMVQTESPAISNVVDSQRMVELPLNGRYATQLIY